jgi:hypothetical protein
MAHLRGIGCALLVGAGAAAAPVANAASWRDAGTISAPEGTHSTFVSDLGTDRTGALTVIYRGGDFNDDLGPRVYVTGRSADRSGSSTCMTRTCSAVETSITPTWR